MNQQTGRLAFSYVRFSSAQQARGASLERQTNAAKRWADENGYTLDTSLNLQDRGVSAYKGDNATTGALSGFLRAVEEGQVPAGSTLLVENLDRISRQKIRKARNTLEEIIDAGVDVVTLANNKRYTQSDLDDDAMTGIEIILTFQRAHEESLTKSKRVKDGWRKNLEAVREGKKKRTKAVPNWLRLVGTLDDGYFEIIEERAQVTRELFARFADGETVWSIAKGFRDRGILTPRGKTFASGNIYRLVKSKAPYGILEIGKGTKNDRTVFDQIDDYFPRIVDEDTQRRVTLRLQGIAQRREGNRIQNNPKRRTHGILTGVIRTAKGERCVCRRGTDGSFAYVETTTRRWLASRNVIESRFLAGWSEIVKAHDTDNHPEVDAAEAAVAAAQSMLETTSRVRSERLLMAAEADLEDARAHLKEVRRGAAISMISVPEDISALEPWEANRWVRMIIDQVTVLRGDRKLGPERNTMLEVTLKNGRKVFLGDIQMVFKDMSDWISDPEEDGYRQRLFEQDLIDRNRPDTS